MEAKMYLDVRSWDPIRKKPLKTLVTAFTLVAFLFSQASYDIAWAARTVPGLSHVSSVGPGGSGASGPEAIDKFSLPPSLGVVKDKCLAKDAKKVIFHIQDAHCNYAAQHKIAEIIDYLVKSYGANVVDLEGGAGDYDLFVFERIADPAVRQKVSDYFVKEGTVNGAEFYAVNNPGAVTLWGLEDPELYMANLKVYRDMLVHKDDIDKWIKSLSHILTNLKPRIYSKTLLDFDSAYNAYKGQAMEPQDYLKALLGYAGKKGVPLEAFPALRGLKEALNKEATLDFKKADIERDALVARLQRSISRKNLKELTAMTEAAAEERISQAALYLYLISKAKEVEIEIKDYPNLSAYIGYISLYDTIDKMELAAEIRQLEDAVWRALCENDGHRQLAELSRHLAIINNIFGITLERDDYLYYLGHKDRFDMRHYVTFVNREAPKYAIQAKLDKDIVSLNKYIEMMNAFYDYSFKRDEAFVRNMKFEGQGARGKGQEIGTAIMVTGGFHTENLCELFKKNNISYISITPTFSNEEGYQCPYLGLLAGKESGIAGTLYPIIAAQYSIAIADKLSPAISKKVWDKANMDAFMSAIWIQEHLAKGSSIAVVDDKGRTLVKFGEGKPEKMTAGALLYEVHQIIYDAQMQRPGIKFTELNKIGGRDVSDVLNEIADFLGKKMGAPPEVTSRVRLLYGTNEETGRPLIRLVSGISFDGHAGGEGIRLNDQLSDNELLETLVHEIVAAFYADHILSGRVARAYINFMKGSSKKPTRILEDVKPAGDKVAAVWEISAEERIARGMDYRAAKREAGAPGAEAEEEAAILGKPQAAGELNIEEVQAEVNAITSAPKTSPQQQLDTARNMLKPIDKLIKIAKAEDEDKKAKDSNYKEGTAVSALRGKLRKYANVILEESTDDDEKKRVLKLFDDVTLPELEAITAKAAKDMGQRGRYSPFGKVGGDWFSDERTPNKRFNLLQIADGRGHGMVASPWTRVLAKAQKELGENFLKEISASNGDEAKINAALMSYHEKLNKRAMEFSETSGRSQVKDYFTFTMLLIDYGAKDGPVVYRLSAGHSHGIIMRKSKEGKIEVADSADEPSSRGTIGGGMGDKGFEQVKPKVVVIKNVSDVIVCCDSYPEAKTNLIVKGKETEEDIHELQTDENGKPLFDDGIPLKFPNSMGRFIEKGRKGVEERWDFDRLEAELSGRANERNMPPVRADDETFKYVNVAEEYAQFLATVAPVAKARILSDKEKAEEMARFDEMEKAATQSHGVLNRDMYEEALARALQEAEDVQVCYLKMQDFKGQLNDRGFRMGVGSHALGDAALRRIGAMLQDELRKALVASKKFSAEEAGSVNIYNLGPEYYIIFKNAGDKKEMIEKVLRGIIEDGSAFKSRVAGIIADDIPAIKNQLEQEPLKLNFYGGLSELSGSRVSGEKEAAEKADELSAHASKAGKYAQLGFSGYHEEFDKKSWRRGDARALPILASLLKTAKKETKSGLTVYTDDLGNEIQYDESFNILRSEYEGINRPIAETYDPDTALTKLLKKYKEAIGSGDAERVKKARSAVIRKMVVYATPNTKGDLIFKGNDYFKMFINHIMRTRPNADIKATFRVGGDEYGALLWDSKSGKLTILRVDGNNIGATTTQWGREIGDRVIDEQLRVIREVLATGGKIEDIPAAIQKRFAEILIQDPNTGEPLKGTLMTEVKYDITEDGLTWQVKDIKSLPNARKPLLAVDGKGNLHEYLVGITYGADGKPEAIITDREGNPITERGPPAPMVFMPNPYQVAIANNDAQEMYILKRNLSASEYEELKAKGSINIKDLTVDLKTPPMVSVGHTEVDSNLPGLGGKLVDVVGGRAVAAAEVASVSADDNATDAKDALKKRQEFNEGRIDEKDLPLAVRAAKPLTVEEVKGLPESKLTPAQEAAQEAIGNEIIALLEEAKEAAKVEVLAGLGLSAADMDDVQKIEETKIVSDHDMEQTTTASRLEVYKGLNKKDEKFNAALKVLMNQGISEDGAALFIAKANTYYFKKMMEQIPALRREVKEGVAVGRAFDEGDDKFNDGVQAAVEVWKRERGLSENAFRRMMLGLIIDGGIAPDKAGLIVAGALGQAPGAAQAAGKGAPSRGFSGLANDVYSAAVRNAIEGRKFAPAAFNAATGTFGRGILKLDNGQIAQGTGLTDAQMQALNAAKDLLSPEDRALLADATILFIAGLDDAIAKEVAARAAAEGRAPPASCYGTHYGIQRNQYYIDTRHLASPQELARQLHHELQERASVMKGLTPEEQSTPMAERSAGTIAKIDSLAKSAHDAIVKAEAVRVAAAPVTQAQKAPVIRLDPAVKFELSRDGVTRKIDNAQYEAIIRHLLGAEVRSAQGLGEVYGRAKNVVITRITYIRSGADKDVFRVEALVDDRPSVFGLRVYRTRGYTTFAKEQEGVVEIAREELDQFNTFRELDGVAIFVKEMVRAKEFENPEVDKKNYNSFYNQLEMNGIGAFSFGEFLDGTALDQIEDAGERKEAYRNAVKTVVRGWLLRFKVRDGKGVSIGDLYGKNLVRRANAVGMGEPVQYIDLGQARYYGFEQLFEQVRRMYVEDGLYADMSDKELDGLIRDAVDEGINDFSDRETGTKVLYREGNVEITVSDVKKAIAPYRDILDIMKARGLTYQKAEAAYYDSLIQRPAAAVNVPQAPAVPIAPAAAAPAMPQAPAAPVILPPDESNLPTDLIGALYDNPNREGLPVSEITPEIRGNRIYLTGKSGAALYDKNGNKVEYVEFGSVVPNDKKDAIMKEMEANLSNLSGEERKTAEAILDYAKNHDIYILSDNAFGIMGMSDPATGRMFINQALLSAIGVFHEAGEAFLASHPALIPQGLNAHTYLRGAGMKERIADPRNHRLGMQDRLFGTDKNNNFSVNIAKLNIRNALSAGDLARARAIFERTIERSALDMYEKGNLRLNIENAENDFRKKENIRKAQEERASRIAKMRAKIAKEGPEAVLRPLLEKGRKISLLTIRRIVHKLSNPALIRSAKIENLRLVSDGVMAGKTLMDDYVGKGVMGELRLEDGSTVNFLLYYNEAGTLEKIFVRTHDKGEDAGAYKGIDPSIMEFALISNGELIDSAGTLLDENDRSAIRAINERIKAVASSYGMIAPAMTDKKDKYQIQRPVVHDKFSRDYILGVIAGHPGLENLVEFMENISFPIPEDMLFLQNLGHPESRGISAGAFIGTSIFTNHKIFPEDVFVHELAHAVFDYLRNFLGIGLDGKIPAYNRGEKVYERDLFFSIINYFKKSDFHHSLKRERMYSFAYDEDGAIRDGYLYAAVTEAFAHTIEAILSFKGYGALRRYAKLRDVEFLVKAKLLPEYFLPAGLYPEFAKVANQEITAENYYFPLIAYLYGHGEKETAMRIFDRAIGGYYADAAKFLQFLAQRGDNNAFGIFFDIAINSEYFQCVRDKKTRYVDVEDRLFELYNACRKLGMNDRAEMAWTLFEIEAQKSPLDIIKIISENMPLETNKKLIKLFIDNADDRMTALALSHMRTDKVKAGGKLAGFASAVAEAIEKRNPDILDEAYALPAAPASVAPQAAPAVAPAPLAAPSAAQLQAQPEIQVQPEGLPLTIPGKGAPLAPTGAVVPPLRLAPPAAQIPTMPEKVGIEAGLSAEARKSIIEGWVAAATQLLESTQFGNEPRVIIIPCESNDLKAQNAGLRQEARRTMEKKYGINVSVIFYDGTKKGLDEALKQAGTQMTDPKALALVYVRQGQSAWFKDGIDSKELGLSAGQKERIKCIQEDMPEKGVLENTVMHVVLGLGILDYVNRQIHNKPDASFDALLFNLIEKLIANPGEVRNLLKDDIGNIFNIILKLQRLDLKDIEDWKRSKDEVLKAL